MSLPIPNTTTQAAYTNATTFPSEQGAGTPYASGYLVIANNPAVVSVLRGSGQGSASWSPELTYTPTTLPISAGLDPTTARIRDFIFGVRVRDAVAGTHAQVFGGLFQLGEVTLNPGNQFGGTVSPSGGFTPTPVTTFTRVTTLPLAPTDGQVALLDLNATFPGVEWLCVFNSSTGFWDVIGGPALPIGVTGVVAAANGWKEMAFVAVPNQGDYQVTLAGGNLLAVTVAHAVQFGVSIAAGVPGSPTEEQSVIDGGNGWPVSTVTQLLTGFTAGQHASLMFNTPTGADQTTFRWSGLAAPVRIK